MFDVIQIPFATLLALLVIAAFIGSAIVMIARGQPLNKVVDFMEKYLEANSAQVKQVQEALANSVPQETFNSSYSLFDLAETYADGDVKKFLEVLEHAFKLVDGDPTNDYEVQG